MPTCPKCRVTYPDGTTACPSDGEDLLPDEAFGAADPDLCAGETVGEYVVEAKLGEGGFGAVFKATHPLIGKQVAIKVLNRQYSANPQMVSRFIAEARAVNQIRHRHIIDIFSFGQLPDGRHYYVMEYLQGVTLDAYLDRAGGRLTVADAIPILRALARALDAAHAKGIAHRDLKPENVFIAQEDDGTPFPKLLDFGIAKLLSDGAAQHKTRTGVPMGTPYYMSPEQCRGRDVDHRTDIYSFGVMTYQILTGRRPFEGEDFMDILLKQMQEAPVPPSSVFPELPPSLDGPVLWMMEKDAGKRPPNLVTAVRALEEAALAHGVAIPAAPRTGVYPGQATPAPTPLPAVTPGKLPPGGAAGLAVAETIAAADSPAVRSFIAAEASNPPAHPRGRGGLVAGGVATVVILGAIALFAFSGTKEGRPRARQAPTGTSPSSAPAASGMPSPTTFSIPAASGTSPPTSTAPAASRAPTLPSASSVAPSPPASSPMVKLAIEDTPVGTEVFAADGTRLGTLPGVIELPRGDQPVALELRAPGYRSQVREVIPSEDRTISVALEKLPPRKPPRKKKPGKDDIENPF